MTIDNGGQVLTATCDKVNYRSEDGGQNWRQREAPAASLTPVPAT